MTQKFRFIKFEHNQKWYAESPRGAVAGLKRQHAELFTEDDWQEWGEAGGWTMEPLGEDEALRRAVTLRNTRRGGRCRCRGLRIDSQGEM